MRLSSSVHKSNFLFVTLLFLCLECDLIIPRITDPIDEARYRDDGGRIRRDDAIALVMPSIYNHYTNCRLDPVSVLMLVRIFNVGCEYDAYRENKYEGCSDFRYLHRERVELCRIVFDSLPCGDSELTSEWFLISLSVCTDAFNEAVTSENYF